MNEQNHDLVLGGHDAGVTKKLLDNDLTAVADVVVVDLSIRDVIWNERVYPLGGSGVGTSKTTKHEMKMVPAL